MSGNGGRRGEPPTPPSGLEGLLDTLTGPFDYWDRPAGNWPSDPGAGSTPDQARAHANACYRMGTKALRRGELQSAANWLSTAAEQDHPGALFRLAVATHRILGADGRDDVVFLLAAAAEAGHGDARPLMQLATDHPTSQVEDSSYAQDPEFADEIRRALTGETLAHHAPASVPERGARLGQPATTVPSAGLHPPTANNFVWSVNPLRPPGLTVAARQVPGRSPAPERWRTVERALRILHTLQGSSVALSAAQLAKATSLPKQILERLLAWLCGQGLAQLLADGAFAPGPVLGTLTLRGAGPAQDAVQQTLAALRDAVGAAVYVSRYTDGEVDISRYSAGPEAPQVYEWVDFKASAHASAVGKSLLAQLSYEDRMDHLSRHRAARLTSRTITDHRLLFHDIDGRGPNAPQFDRQEYSTSEVCVAIPLHHGGGADCLALSLPVAQQHRLEEAARILSRRSNAVLLSLLLAGEPPMERSAQMQGAIVVVPPLEWTQKPQDSITLVPPQAVLIPPLSRSAPPSPEHGIPKDPGITAPARGPNPPSEERSNHEHNDFFGEPLMSPPTGHENAPEPRPIVAMAPMSEVCPA
ncbi:IclR family transcriptional regulator C-terminal domain-containing protein [Streptomyces sp. NPDC059072]|uniref:IclR family transcriptional regulator domain-containing protein n=1 Tax=Streptomyces sp. NPDC059072 TaxID=3346715 RepID=UPI00367F8487